MELFFLKKCPVLDDCVTRANMSSVLASGQAGAGRIFWLLLFTVYVTKPQKSKQQSNAKYSVVVRLEGTIILHLWTEWASVKVTRVLRES
jgi:hypothetical protein